jgi:hypothetical protein
MIPTGQYPKCLAIDGHLVCIRCYGHAFGDCSRATMNRYIVRARDGCSNYEHGNGASNGKNVKNIKFKIACNAVEEYLKVADLLPDKTAIQTVERTTKELYNHIIALQDPHPFYQFSESTFKRALEHVQTITDTSIRVNQTKMFATCSLCARFDNEVKNIGKIKPLDRNKLNEIDAQRKQHIKEQSNERKHFYSIVNKCMQSPNHCWCFMQDGME